ncbi:type II secretion system minor pseudopilin GspI [Marinospirillum perlucidum]|uniref:type II secretion system minor pseudopilin GspI n=1 Tax=Marinospirillum perlucidum TaxID=1982602 RepID=UPI000DF256E2|nr:type II secretion system minor pseudopilin GspI [Marinospirillum perlucidum]
MKTSHQEGMTLVEVLVALFILALLAGMANQVVTRAVDVRLAAEERSLAQLCADNLLMARLIEKDVWPELGREEGEQTYAGQTCYWLLEVQGTPLPTMRRLDISVFASDERSYQLARVSGFVGQ